MKSSKVATRYAQALIELSIEQNNLEAISADMNYFTEVCEANRDFEVMLESPIVKADKKIAVINAIFEQFHPLSKSFAELITRNGREAMLPQIAIAFSDLLKAHNGILPITLVSAKPLADSVKKSILAKVQGSVEGKLEVTELIDEALVGGFIVRMGDFQIDASVASQLGQLKQRLTR
ncbi:MAG: ATP synthase F1 subunit delta [Fluviicola sp.]|nr:ATP synthase F1 subunit delta [Fluviicola sp.]